MISYLAYLRAACFGLFIVSASAAGAENVASASGELTLPQAIAVALERNPELQVSVYELRAADARITQAGLRPNPELGLELENFAGDGDLSGADALETTLSLSQVIELGGKRSRRVDLAALERDDKSIERQALQLDVLAQVTRRFVEVVVAQEQLSLMRDASGLAEKTLAAIKTRVEAARTPQAEQSRAAIALTRARLAQRQTEVALESTRRSLIALWGDTTPAFATARADLFTLTPTRNLETLTANVQRNPDFLRFASEARLRAAELELARAQAKPDLTLGAGLRRLEQSGDTALVAGVSLPLALFNRNQGAIREAEARHEQTEAAKQAALIRANATLFALYQELLQNRAAVETLRSEARPQAQAALEQTQYGYERGRFSYLELAATQQELIEVQRAAIESAANYHRLLAEIERLTGEALAQPQGN
ncbi:MAG: TolC family protein [Nevskiales bacterium]